MSQGFLSPLPRGWEVRGSVATAETVLERKCGLCCRRHGRYAVLVLVYSQAGARDVALA